MPEDAARAIMRDRQPMSAQRALLSGFSDACVDGDIASFRTEVARRAAAFATTPDFASRLAAKREVRARDEAVKPLAAYRAEEMATDAAQLLRLRSQLPHCATSLCAEVARLVDASASGASSRFGVDHSLIQ